jgi:lysozyme
MPFGRSGALTVGALSLAASLAVVGLGCGGDAGDPAQSTMEQALTRVCGAPTNGPVQGYDVSVYQGAFTWAGSGVQFGYARVSDGTANIDSTFAGNWSRMKAAGVLRGAYQFFRPGRDEVAQANIMIDAVGGQLGAGDMPCMIDVEATDSQSGATIAAKVRHWLQLVEAATGKRPIIYTGGYFWQDNVGDTSFGAYPLWIAAYGPTCPSIPDGWSNWLIWQYSDGGGSLDHDVFNGSYADLQNLAGAVASCPRSDGAYCGGDGVGGNPGTLYQCTAGNLSAIQTCPNGCERGADGQGRCVQVPRGSLDSAACTTIAGWAQDPNTPDAPAFVDLYFDGPAGSSTVTASMRVAADGHRDDLCSALGSCDHAFSVPTPAALKDGRAHQVWAYAISTVGGSSNPLLGAAPRSFRCAVAKAGDFDGDGRSDVIQYRGDWRSIPVCLSSGSGWSCKNLPADVRDGGEALVGDFDGDRRADVIQYSSDWQSVPVCLSTGSGWSCRDLPATYVGGEGNPGNAGSAVYRGGRPFVVDFNGDGYSDLVQFSPDWQTLPVCLSTGTGWSCKNLAAHYVGGAGSGNGGYAVYPGATPLVGDFDGDGKADLMQFDAGWSTIPVCLSLGTGWSCRNVDAPLAGASGKGIFAGTIPLVGDFDGDHRSDVIQFADDRDDLPVCLSTGSGWSCRDLRASYAGGLGAGNHGAGIYPGGTPLVGDFDGDGRSDVIEYDAVDGGSSIPVCLSTGSGWSCRNVAASGLSGSGVSPLTMPVLADVDGDGRTDVVEYQCDGRTTIPACLSTGSGWSCRDVAASYAGGLGAGNGGSGVWGTP